MTKLRVGAPDFISVRPLVYGLIRGAHPGIEITYAQPGQLTELLEQGELDAALVPSIEFLRGVGHDLLEGPALVAKPAPGSVLLATTKPIDEVSRIAVGEFCRSPVAVLRITLAERYQVLPDLCVAKNFENWQERYDGILLSGDSTLDYACGSKGPCEVHNISELWNAVTLVPLVLALWVYKDKKHAGALSKSLIASRNLGMQNLSRLADGIAQTTAYESKFLHDHFVSCWDYHFADMEWEGLRVLEEYALRYSILQEARIQKLTV